MKKIDQVFHCWYFTNSNIEAKILEKSYRSLKSQRNNFSNANAKANFLLSVYLITPRPALNHVRGNKLSHLITPQHIFDPNIYLSYLTM